MMTKTDKEATLNKSGAKNWSPFEKLFGMRREAPEFRRCCFCVPLRRGLIGWGYIKLALNMLAIGLTVFLAAYVEVAAVLILEMVFLLTDTAFNVLLIVGGHQKNIKFLKIAYIYSLVWMGMALVSFCWLAYMEIHLAVQLISIRIHYAFVLTVLLPGFCVQFAIFFVQIYWVLLIRSLVAKLQDQTVDVQFTNPSSTEAQCTLHKHNPPATEAQCTLHKHNPSLTEPHCALHSASAAEDLCTLHKHNPSATEAQCTLHKHNPSVAEPHYAYALHNTSAAEAQCTPDNHNPSAAEAVHAAQM